MTIVEAVKTLFARLLYSVVIPAGIIVAALYIFNSLGDITYLTASVLAFAVGFFAIYLVFKYWISVEAGQETPEQQMTRFMIVFVINVALNTELVYLLVTYAYVPLLTAQAMAAVIVAYESYYAYRSLVFNARKRETVAESAGSNAVTPEYADKVRSDAPQA